MVKAVYFILFTLAFTKRYNLALFGSWFSHFGTNGIRNLNLLHLFDPSGYYEIWPSPQHTTIQQNTGEGFDAILTIGACVICRLTLHFIAISTESEIQFPKISFNAKIDSNPCRNRRWIPHGIQWVLALQTGVYSEESTVYFCKNNSIYNNTKLNLNNRLWLPIS